jgi:hypothetical protein
MNKFKLLLISSNVYVGDACRSRTRCGERERQADFEMQKRLEEEYRNIQTVSDGRSTVDGKNLGQGT